MSLTLDDLKKAQQHLSGVFGTGAIMGGAVRDTLCQRPVKDIDFYVDYAEMRGSRIHMEWLKSGDVAYDHQYLWGVEDDAYEYAGYPVQLMVNQRGISPLAVLHKFDIGLCMCAIDTEGNLYTTPEFSTDRANSTLTIYRHGWGETGVQKHVERLKKKYVGWRVVRNDLGEN